jgi:hypothetical protein
MDVEVVGDDEQARLERLLRKHRKKLLALPNVHDVDIGFELADGEPTGRLAVRVYVDKKRSPRGLRVADRAPEEIDGVPVDVIEFNPELHLTRTDLHNPVIGGVQIMNANKSSAGTLGMVVLHRDTLRPLALSNQHVMQRTPADPIDVMVQPTAAFANILGPVVASDKALDCAVCELGTRPSSFDIFGLDQVAGSAQARLGMKVVKSGLTSGVTFGVVDGMNAERITIVPGSSPAASGQVSLPGDSGSIWLELATNLAVGLHFSGNAEGDSERGNAKRIELVLKKLNVTVFDGAVIGQAVIGGHCKVRARTAPGAKCDLTVVYPSGRRSSASGLGTKRADGNGWVEWSWRIGTHTKRAGAGVGFPLGRPLVASLSLAGGTTRRLERFLDGTSSTA